MYLGEGGADGHVDDTVLPVRARGDVRVAARQALALCHTSHSPRVTHLPSRAQAAMPPMMSSSSHWALTRMSEVGE